MAENYEDATRVYRLAGVPRDWIGTKEPRRCRFCHKERRPGEKSNPFKNEAHAIPCLLGNESLFPYEECNECNTLFGRWENSLAEFVKPPRALMGIGGRDGVPAFKDQNLRIERSGDRGEITQKKGDPVIYFDQASRKVQGTLTVGTYSPMALYKCFTKMALSIMSAEDLKEYRRAREWLLCRNHARNLGCFAGHGCYYYFTPGHSSIVPWVRLFRRRDDGACLPHMLLVVGTASILFVTMVPLSDRDDHLQGRTFVVPRLGKPTGPGQPFGPATVTRVPLSSAERVRGLSVAFSFHVDRFEWLNEPTS